MTFEQAVAKVQDIMKEAKPAEIGDVAVQIHFTNKDCDGIMYIACRGGELDIAGYDYKDNDVAIDIMYGDLTKILKGTMSVANAVSKELISISGNADALNSIAGSAKKPAVKKAAVKKDDPKKTAPAKTEKAAETAKTAEKPAVKTATKTVAKTTTAKKTTKTSK